LAWLVSVPAPLVTTFAYSTFILHNGGLSVHSITPIYVMFGVCAVLAIASVLLLGFRWWGKILLCLISVGMQWGAVFLGEVWASLCIDSAW